MIETVSKTSTNTVNAVITTPTITPDTTLTLFQAHTRRGDWVLDPFNPIQSGSLVLASAAKRNSIGIESNPMRAKTFGSAVSQEARNHNVASHLSIGNPLEVNYHEVLKSAGAESVEFVILNPIVNDLFTLYQDRQTILHVFRPLVWQIRDILADSGVVYLRLDDLVAFNRLSKLSKGIIDVFSEYGLIPDYWCYRTSDHDYNFCICSMRKVLK